MRVPQMLSCSVVRAGFFLAFGFALAGCNSGGWGRDPAVSLTPAMPTIGPATAAPPAPRTPDAEIVATAARLALNNDLPAALRTLELAGDAADRSRVGTQLVETLAAQNPATAAGVALSLPTGPSQTTAVGIAARAFVARDSAAALRWAMGAFDSSAAANTARRAIAGEVIRGENPRAALDRLKALPAAPARDDLLGFAAAAWAGRDANAATSWLRDQPDDALRQRLTSNMAFEIAQTAPDPAVALAESLPPGRDRWLIYSAIAQTWIIKDPQAALAWTRRLSPGEARDSALAGVETGLGVPPSRRPTSDLRIRSSNSRSARSDGAMAAWEPEINSPAFAAWLATQPRSMTRDEAILEFVRQRGSQDVGTIGNWIASLPGGTTRQRAIEIYFEEVVRGSPAQAANWLSSLPSSDRSDEMVEKTARQWLLTDPRAAAAWLRDTTTLPAFRKEELLRNVPR